MGKGCLFKFGIEGEPGAKVFPAEIIFFDEEIAGEFIFIDLDDVDSGLGFAKTMMVIKSVGGSLAQLLELGHWLPRKTILPGNKLIVIH